MEPLPDRAVIDRVGAILGWTPRRWEPARGGYTATARYRVSNGREAAFVKVATTPLTARFVKNEIAFYAGVAAPFVPRHLGSSDDDIAPLLVIEDLGAATWPPPWTPGTVDAVLARIAEMHATETEVLANRVQNDVWGGGWRVVADDPAPFLALGVVDREWLVRALPALIAAQEACPIDGDALAHWDLRSDNMCLGPAGVKFVDWAEAGRGNPKLDLGFWLPSLAQEGGPAPHEILPGAPEVAAFVSGFFASRAGLPDIPDAPFVRRVQREQLSTALPWASRELGLR